MKKQVVFTFCAAALLSLATGCAMCNDPIANDPSCIEPKHDSNLEMAPAPLAFTGPTIASCQDVFQPTFRAGDKRFTVVGVGKSLEEATDSAIAQFLEDANCDYIVAVSRKVTVKTHPTYRLFTTKNYTVTLSGLPIYLDKLVKLPPQAQVKEAETPVKEAAPSLTKADVAEAVASALDQQKNQSPFGLLKLSDISVQIQAKGATPDHLGVAFPAPKN